MSSDVNNSPDPIPGASALPFELSCRRMNGPERYDAFALLGRTVDEAALGSALTLFTDREDLGFVWLAFADDRPVGACVATTTISIRAGGLALRIAEIAVADDVDRIAVARGMLAALVKHVRAFGIVRFEAQASGDDAAARELYIACGMRAGDAEVPYVLER